jgi:hypothetical protein
MDLVHKTVNRTCASPRWTVDRGGGGGSSELGLAATSEHGSSRVEAQQREGDTGIPARASPGRAQQCGGRVTVVKKRQRRRSVRAALRRGEKRRRAGEVRWKAAGLSLYIGGEREAAARD